MVCHGIPLASIGLHRAPQGSMRIYRDPSACKGRATQLVGTSCVNYAGVMQELCGIDEPRIPQESRRIFMNASEPMGILWVFIQIIPQDFIGFHIIPQDCDDFPRIPQGDMVCHGIPPASIGLHRASQGSMRIYRDPSASKGRATPLAGTSCVNYAGVMRELCGIAELHFL